MGHHAQYRKRGSTRPGEDRRQAPPEPVLTTEARTITVTPTGLDDTGGIFRTYAKYGDDGYFQPAGDFGWANPQTVVIPPFAQPVWVYATEIGNGTAYGGESYPSNTVYFQPV